jgi:hypothetical protein
LALRLRLAFPVRKTSYPVRRELQEVLPSRVLLPAPEARPIRPELVRLPELVVVAHSVPVAMSLVAGRRLLEPAARRFL